MNSGFILLLLAASLVGNASVSAATADWTGAAGNDLWLNPANWAGQKLPESQDDVVISAKGMTISLVGDATVQGLELGDGTTLEIAGGTLRANAALRTYGGLDSPGGIGSSIRVVAGGRFEAPAAAALLGCRLVLDGGAAHLPSLLTLDDSSVVVRNGAQFTLADGVASYERAGKFDDWFVAEGENSSLDLRPLKTLKAAWQGHIRAENNGTIDLGRCVSLDLRYYTGLRLATGGMVKLGSLREFVGQNGASAQLAVERFEVPSLEQLAGITFTLEPGDLPLGSTVSLGKIVRLSDCRFNIPSGVRVEAPFLTRFEGSGLTLGGSGELRTAELTTIDDSYIVVQHGARYILSPKVTNYVGLMKGHGFLGWDLFVAEGPGSHLDLSSLKTLDVTKSVGMIRAEDSGEIDLSGCVSLALRGSAGASVTSSGILRLDSLRELAGSKQLMTVAVEHFTLPALERLEGVDLALEPRDLAAGTTVSLGKAVEATRCRLQIPGRGRVEAPHLARFLGSSLELAGTGALDAPELASIDSSSVYVKSGARYTLPQTVTGYVGGDLSFEGGWAWFAAEDQDSTLDLRALKDILGIKYGGITVSGGATIDLSECGSISLESNEARVTIEPGGRLRLDRLQRLRGGSPPLVSGLYVRETLSLPSVQALNALHVEVARDAAMVCGNSPVEFGACDIGLEARASLQGGFLRFSSGRLWGSGEVKANVTNEGLLDPGDLAGTATGTLTVQGNYTQTGKGSLRVHVAGRFNRTDLLRLVGGNASLGGALYPEVVGFTPLSGEAFEVITWDRSPAGDFPSYGSLKINDELEFRPLYSASNLILKVENGRGPRVESTSPAHAETVTTAFNHVSVAFNELIDPNSVSTDDLVVWSPSGEAVAVTAVTQSATYAFQFTLAEQMAVGIYTLTLGPDVRDFAQFPMDQNSNGIGGEAADAYRWHVTVAGGYLDWCRQQWPEQCEAPGTHPGDDFDGDGLANEEERRRGTNPKLVDTDGDGYTDGYEIQNGDDPRDPNVPPPNRPIEIRVEPAVALLFDGKIGTNYRIEYSGDLESWLEFKAPIPGSGTNQFEFDWAYETNRYYRLLELPR